MANKITQSLPDASVEPEPQAIVDFLSRILLPAVRAMRRAINQWANTGVELPGFASGAEPADQKIGTTIFNTTSQRVRVFTSGGWVDM